MHNSHAALRLFVTEREASVEFTKFVFPIMKPISLADWGSCWMTPTLAYRLQIRGLVACIRL